MSDPWLTTVLTRGDGPDPCRPWRPADPAARAAADRDVRAGLLQRVVGDVVVARDTPVDALARAGSLALLLPPGLVVLSWAAAWVHLGPPLAPPTEVAVAGHRLPELAGASGVRIAFSRVRPAPQETLALGPLVLTTPARSLLDAAATHPYRAGRLRAALREAGLLAEQDLHEASGRARGRQNVRTARRALRLPRVATAPISPSAASRS
ncbi:hypothetical protein [Kineococcus sp. SYSU DK003]|uniref:hypothetical protein n=1 Tax=Kineococcus sp. SYSU DK003 TaxID=3383124 RepID=UPI003D7E8CFE